MNEIMSIENLPVKYQTMLSRISDRFLIIERDARNFNKTQSQFMNHVMTVSQPTALRSMRQILAEIKRKKEALDEAYFKLRKKKVKQKKKKRLLETTTDPLDREMLEIEIAEIDSRIATTMGYVEGAIRSISSYMAQYDNLLEQIGKDELTEEDFEKDEERYHIMTAFTQALIAARARGGMIDEGNYIYFHQIGINGTMAQCEITSYLSNEGRMVAEGNAVPHDNVTRWLDDIADKYKGCAEAFTKARGLKLLDTNSCHK
jgi:hypothetical protein